MYLRDQNDHILMGRSLGMNHCHLTQCNPRSSKKRYNLGALSKKPFTGNKSHTPETLAHGCQELLVEDCPFRIFNIHLVARGEEERIQEQVSQTLQPCGSLRCAVFFFFFFFLKPADIDIRNSRHGMHRS